jgi:hypothetical protein
VRKSHSSQGNDQHTADIRTVSVSAAKIQI